MSDDRQTDRDRALVILDAAIDHFDLSTHPKRFVTTAMLADYLDTERRTIVRMITEGTLLAVKVGREWRVDIESARQAFHVQRKAG